MENAIINLRVSGDQKTKYDAAAKAASMALSVWIRLILDATIDKMKDKS